MKGGREWISGKCTMNKAQRGTMCRGPSGWVQFTCMTAWISCQSTAKTAGNQPDTGYGSQMSKVWLVQYTAPIWWCHTYGPYRLWATSLDANVGLQWKCIMVSIPIHLPFEGCMGQHVVLMMCVLLSFCQKLTVTCPPECATTLTVPSSFPAKLVSASTH